MNYNLYSLFNLVSTGMNFFVFFREDDLLTCKKSTKNKTTA